jgi:hypothetical protein
MIDQKAKTDHLEKVLNSTGFYKSRRYKELLKFLVKAEMEGRPVKETTLAIDLFEKDASFNPAEDTVVRVSIGNIRKRLSNYYYTEGASDSLRMEIPKGSYNLVFKNVKPGQYRFWNVRRRLMFVVMAAGIGIVLSGFIFMLLKNRELEKRFFPVESDNAIWHEFISSGIPPMIVMGDHFFMYEMHEKEKRRIFIRDTRVNSLEEYNSKSSTMLRPWQPLEFTYLTEATAISMTEILPVLMMNPQKTVVKQASQLIWADFNQFNIIFTGTVKCTFELQKLLPNFHIQVERDSVYQLQRLDDRGDVVEIYPLPRSGPNNMITDYAYVGKIRGPGNHAVMIITSGDDVGLNYAVKTLVSPDFTNKLKQQYPGISSESPFYFEMILKVEGVRRTEFKSEIVFFREISEHESLK